jgi:hypothetical protein
MILLWTGNPPDELIDTASATALFNCIFYKRLLTLSALWLILKVH